MNPRTLFYKRIGQVSVSLLFEVRDLWIGIYWDRHEARTIIYLCIVPTLPIRVIVWEAQS